MAVKRNVSKKNVPFKTKIELACEIIDEHTPLGSVRK